MDREGDGRNGHPLMASVFEVSEPVTYVCVCVCVCVCGVCVGVGLVLQAVMFFFVF